MRTFSQKPKATQKAKSASSSWSRRALVGQSREVYSILQLQRLFGNQDSLCLLQVNDEGRKDNLLTSTSARFAHDFSRIPVKANAFPSIQPKLKISTPRNEYEQEADRIADRVLKQEIPEEGENHNAEIRANDTSRNRDISKHLENRLNRSKGGGSQLSYSSRTFFEPRMLHDFSEVRVHTDKEAVQMNQELKAKAFTHYRDIYFGLGQYNPRSHEGKLLLAHELTHVLQQTSSRLKQIQRRVNPEDVSDEMIGQAFVVEGPFTSGVIQLSGGETVYVVSWTNTSDTARVQLPTPYIHALTPFDIPKTLLRPAGSGVAGIAPYHAGVGQQVRSIERGEQRITAERSRQGGPRPGEIPRLEQLQQRRLRLLNRRLIQETMFNRFDSIIQRWTHYYNQQFGYTGSDVLDSNLVKAMLFQESQMGTAGQHLEMSPTWEVRSRFNVGQVIDSAAAALLIMMREMQPTLITSYHLQNIDRDRVQAQQDFSRLSAARSRTPDEQRRLTELQAIKAQSSSWGLSFAETFMWLYRAPGERRGFNEAVEELFSSVALGQPRRSLDYDFWIRTVIRWLFEKRRSVSSWQEAIRAYNGSGARARHYREAVQRRAREATTAPGSGSEYIPSGI